MLKKLLLAAFVCCLSVIAASAQNFPTFAKYPAAVSKIKAKQPDLGSHKNARMFRTNLRTAASEGINFAGRFVFTTWGCGTNCAQSAIIDARTGRVFFPRELEGIGIGFCELDDVEAEPLEFKPNSRLLILRGFKGGDLNAEREPCGIYYFEWTGTALKQVGFDRKKRTDTP